MALTDDAVGGINEMIASYHASNEEVDAYERVLGDAMVGDATLFAREDYVEEAWRIVDPVLQTSTPIFPFEPGTRSPEEVKARVGGIRGRELELTYSD